MFKRILSFVALLLSFSFVASVSWAAEASLYNCNVERLKGKPTPYEVGFSANEGQGRLVLQNGTPEASFRVSSATISLNGTVIVDSEAFNQNIPNLTVDIPLEKYNVLVVQLVSAPESFIDIAITQVADAVAFVDESGGNIEVVDSSSPLEGVSLSIPPNAIKESAIISIEAAETPPEAPERGAFAGEVIELKPDGLTFEKPVTLTFPYNDVNNDGIVDGTSIDEEFVSVGYFNEITQLWEQLKIISRDPQENIVSAEIEHFSIYSPFVRVDNIIPQTTQEPPEGGFNINGDPIDWRVESIKPTMSEPDPRDSTCDQGSDIKHVYTAMDSQFAYVMIEMWEGLIDPDMSISLFVDSKKGKDILNSTYGDFRLNFRGYDVSEGYITDGQSDSGSVSFGYSSANPLVGAKTSRGAVLEAKIPLELINYPSYFNVTKVRSHIEGYPNLCDVDEMYPKINWFKLQKRIYADRDDRVTFIFGQISRAGKYLFEPDIDEAVVTRPDETTITFNAGDLVSSPQSSAWGFYSNLFKTFVYQNYLSENYFQKHYYDGEEELQNGKYKFSLTNTTGDIYESESLVTRTEDIPTVDSNTVQCHIHQEGDVQENELFGDLETANLFSISQGDLYCDWEYPAYIGDPDFSDVNETIYAHPFFRAYQGQNLLRYTYPSIPFFNQKIVNFAIVPAADLSKLVDGSDKLTISVRTRVKSDSVRSYSAEKEINF